MNFDPEVVHESKSLPGVKFTVRQLNQFERSRRELKVIDARARVTDLDGRRKALPEVPENEIERAKLDREIGIEIVLNIRPVYLRAGFVSAEGLTIQGQPVTVDLLLDAGPDGFIDEVYEACHGAAGLAVDESKNSQPSGISSAAARPGGESTTAIPAAM